MAEGLMCSIANCGYITTTKVPDETEIQYKMPMLQLLLQTTVRRSSVTSWYGG